ncbi:hypothetical protein OSB04_007225 [Centaurea solstitialis]|uniref:Uncharacterized protein n=1 Tax=Centaurea solstitialis TaxID=347529 RepID=A0AA38TJG5_9ASTR|nr:hypothetical protein OSB04_007225 [Centaurea solstitialis]
MKAAVMWTISDFPGLGMLGGIQTKGYKACPICLDDTDAKFSHGRMSYMGARRWLDMNHEFRVQGRNFNGKNEFRLAPQTRTAIQVYKEIVSHRYPRLSLVKEKKSSQVFFEIDWNGESGDALFEWIHITARNAFKRWKSDCHKLYKLQGRFPIPKNFVHRPCQWEFFCTLFETETWKNKSKRMSEARLSAKRVEHGLGPILFRYRANEHVASGDVAPHLCTISETTKSEERKRLVLEAIEKIENDPNNVEPPIRCPVEKEISIIEEIVGPSVGTVVRGMGSLAVRAPRMRGPAKGSTSKPVSTVSEETLRLQLAERDDEIRLLKEAQNEAKEEAAKQKKLLDKLLKRMNASDGDSNTTTPTSHALG